jgi:hypothetical protein
MRPPFTSSEHDRMDATRQDPQVHTTVIQSDAPFRIEVGAADDGRFFRLLNHLIDSGLWARLSDASRAVLPVYARHANRDGLAWPSVDSLIAASGMKRSACYAAIAELRRLGLLILEAEGGRRQTSTYRVAAVPNRPPRRTEDSPESAQLDTSVRPGGRSVHPGGLPSLYLKKTIEPDELNQTAAAAPRTRRLPTPPAPADEHEAAAALLRSEEFGFGEREAKALVETGGPRHVRDMVDNVRYLKRAGKLQKTPKRYLRSAIRGGYGLYQEVEAQRMNELYRRLTARLDAVCRPRLTGETSELLERAFKDPATTVRRGVLSIEELEDQDDDAVWATLISRAREAATGAHV